MLSSSFRLFAGWILGFGLLCLVFFSKSLGCSMKPALPSEGFPCGPGGTCDIGLTCVDGICEVDPCFGVECNEGEVCVDGGCYAGSCEDRDCPAGLICLDGDCVGRACAGVTCDPGYACADGGCYPTDCAGVDCGAGVCVDGECVPRSCVGVTCPEGEACALGECYPTDCAGVDCGAGVCVDGECMPRSCVGVTCPEGEACAIGECYPADCATPCTPEEVCVHGECVEAACMGVICPDEQTCAGGICLPSDDCEPGFGEHEDYPGECHAELQVPCDPADVEPPENASIDDDEFVTIVWDDVSGWSEPASCGWSCDEGYVLDEQQPHECVLEEVQCIDLNEEISLFVQNARFEGYGIAYDLGGEYSYKSLLFQSQEDDDALGGPVIELGDGRMYQGYLHYSNDYWVFSVYTFHDSGNTYNGIWDNPHCDIDSLPSRGWEDRALDTFLVEEVPHIEEN